MKIGALALLAVLAVAGCSCLSNRTVHRPSRTPGVNLAAATPARLPVHVWPAADEPTAVEAV
jgi:hypothetical protein